MRTRKNKKYLSWNNKCKLSIALSFVGTIIFFAIPYARVVYYSLIRNQFNRKFVGLSNYIKTLSNPYFLLALKNSILLIVIGVPILIILSLLLSLILAYKSPRVKRFKTAFILPMLIPTASIVLSWNVFFSHIDNSMPIYLLFIWKNIGICIILMSSALTGIDEDLFEAASLEGIRGHQIHRYITVPLISPTIFFTTLLSIVNSFKIFKESYLYYGGNYPPNYSYTLQYYMNNNFLKLDYQSLATSAILTSLLILFIVIWGIRIQSKYEF